MPKQTAGRLPVILSMKEKIPEEHRQRPIYADSQGAEIIEELCNAGFNVYPCKKGPGSVKAGILFTRRFKRYTNVENVNLNKEDKHYKWRMDKNGHLLDEPVKFKDDCEDAVRYPLYTHFEDYSQEPWVHTA